MSYNYDIFKEICKKEGNRLVSPVSIMYAFAMVANGADGNTLKELLDVFADGKDLDRLNNSLSQARQQLAGNKNLRLANSIWVNAQDQKALAEKFTKAVKNKYAAEVNAQPFDDGITDTINSFVKRHTGGMIPKLVDEIDKKCFMVLVNALAFKAQWEAPFEKEVTRKGTFKNADKSTSEVDYMFTTECDYIGNDNAEGFVKGYKGGRYYFMAIKPKGSKSLKSVINTLDQSVIDSLLESTGRYDPQIKFPKFDIEDKTNLIDIMKTLGVNDAFDNNADFSNITNNALPLYIGNAQHKARISVNENGTKAAAATAVYAACMGIPVPKQIRKVTFNKPFVYFILDENNTPVFMGRAEKL